MKVIFLIGAVHALFFSFLIFNKKEKNVSDKILAIWLLFFFLNLVFPYLYYGENYKKYIHLGGIDTPFILLHSAFLLMYAKALISKKSRFQKKWLWYLLPYVMFNISLTPYFLTSTKEKIALYENRIEVPRYLYAYPILLVILLTAYIVYTLKLLNKHSKIIKEEYSYKKDVDLTWVRNLVYLIIAFTSIILIYSLCIMLFGLSFTHGYILLFFFLVVIVYIISLFGYKQGSIFIYKQPDKEPDKDKQEVEKNNIVTISKKDKAFIQQLESFMEEQKPYLNNELSLYDLASLINVSTSYLSWCINNCLHTNFYSFINKYRVQEFQQRIHKNESKDFTLQSIAFNSGFNSKATFNRIFKEFTGKTPTEYLKSLNQPE